MSATAERIAPAAPDHRPSDEELHRMVYGEPDDGPDEIVYKNPRGTFFTTRAERERAARIWKEEGQVDYPDNAAESLARTERMLRFRLNVMEPKEFTHAAPDLVAAAHGRVRRIADAHAVHTETAPETPAWVGDATGNFQLDHTGMPEDASRPEQYKGRHRSRRLRMPLAHLLRRKHVSRHAVK